MKSLGRPARLAAFLGHWEAAGRGLSERGKGGDDDIDPDDGMKGEVVMDKGAFLREARLDLLPM